MLPVRIRAVSVAPGMRHLAKVAATPESCCHLPLSSITRGWPEAYSRTNSFVLPSRSNEKELANLKEGLGGLHIWLRTSVLPPPACPKSPLLKVQSAFWAILAGVELTEGVLFGQAPPTIKKEEKPFDFSSMVR